MLIFLYSALIVVFDQLFKQWIILTHSVGQETVLIPGFFSLFRLHNPGAAFGFMAGLPWWVLAAIQLIAVVILIMIILRYTEGFWGSLGLASVLGGAVGNLVDRVMHQHVVDMFRFTFVDFAIFNLADVFITLGFLIFLCHYIAQTFKPKKKNDDYADGDDAFDDDYDQSEASADAVVEGVPVVAPVPVSAPVDFEALAQVDPVAYGAPVAQAATDGQAIVQPIAQPVPPPMPPPPVPPPAPQPVLQPIPQAIQPVPQPIPQEAIAPPENLTQPVDPIAVFGASTNVEPTAPLLDPSSHTGPLPTVEIKPLLDHVYGGQYLQKQEAAAVVPVAPVAPVPQPVPIAPAAPIAQPAPVAPAAPIAQPVPVAPATPIAQPMPVAPAAPVPQPAPVAPAAPIAQPVPVAPATPIAQPMPVAPAAPVPQPAPVAPVATPTEFPTPAAVVPSTSDSPETMLDALTALESELLGESALDDYNADKLLGEYGFESETKD